MTSDNHIRLIGSVSGYATGTVAFNVYVPSEGDYSVNISYLTAVSRSMTARVNNGGNVLFQFISTGRWCYMGGKSSVVAIELKGFRKGLNTITFGDNMQNVGPLLEWISVVTNWRQR